MSMNIVLFDGFCNLCSRSVLFITKHDKEKRISFASLQSEMAKKILLEKGYDQLHIDSVIFITGEKIYFKSDAAIEIAKQLKGLPHYFKLVHYIPKTVRDFLYDCVSTTRYAIFGKRSTCNIPPREMKNTSN